MAFEDFSKGGVSRPLCKDVPASASMLRVVFKSNLTHAMADDLYNHINDIMDHYKEVEPKIVEKRNCMLQLNAIRGQVERSSNNNFSDISSVRKAMEERRASARATHIRTNSHTAC